MSDDFNKDPQWLTDGITNKEAAVFYVFALLLWGTILFPLIAGFM
jgi:hypothetical protein